MLKKIIALILAFTMIMCSNAYAFNFPQPDWGALLNEKQMMVDTTHYDLFAEGSLDNAPYYGAKFEPRGGVYLGAIAETADHILPLGSYLTYIEGMGQPDLYYPANVMIQNDNVVAMVGWTINDLGEVNYDVIRDVLNTLNGYNKPIFIRFANEMNVSPIGDEPDRYVEIFRNVANMVHEYSNLAVVWSPNDLGGLDRPFEYYYPGDEYVDWIGVSCYMIKYFQGNKNTAQKDTVYFMTGDYAWATNRIKPIVDFMKKNNINKPLMVSEGGVPTNNKFGEDLEEWAAPRLRNMLYSLIMAYPQIKMINYFNIQRDEAERYNINEYPYAVDIFNEAKNSGAYITEYGRDAEFVYTPASKAGAIQAKDGAVKLHTLAHFPSNPSGIHVNYYIDGEWYHSSDMIPYTCPLYMDGLADGTHSLTVSTLNQNMETSFTKTGNYITFGKASDIPGNINQGNSGNNNDGGQNKWSENTGYDTEYFGNVFNPNNWNNNSGKEALEIVSIVINGELKLFDTPAFIKDSRTLVPLRGIFESLGASVEWIDETSTVIAERDGITISLSIGDNIMIVDGDEVELDVTAQLYNDRTYVPIRAVSEALGAYVDWEDSTRTVIIEG